MLMLKFCKYFCCCQKRREFNDARNTTYIHQKNRKQRSLEEVMAVRHGTAGGITGDSTQLYRHHNDNAIVKKKLTDEELLVKVGGDKDMVHISNEEGMRLRTVLATRVSC